MNVRIFWVRAMKCMCAQTKPWIILSSEGVFLGGMEFEPMLTPREKSPLLENVPRGGSNPWHCGQQAQALPTELFRPQLLLFMWEHTAWYHGVLSTKSTLTRNYCFYLVATLDSSEFSSFNTLGCASDWCSIYKSQTYFYTNNSSSSYSNDNYCNTTETIHSNIEILRIIITWGRCNS